MAVEGGLVVEGEEEEEEEVVVEDGLGAVEGVVVAVVEGVGDEAVC